MRVQPELLSRDRDINRALVFLRYTRVANRKPTDFQSQLAFYARAIKIDITEGKAVIETDMDIPDEAREKLLENLKEIIPSVKELEFKKVEKKKKEVVPETKEENSEQSSEIPSEDRPSEETEPTKE